METASGLEIGTVSNLRFLDILLTRATWTGLQRGSQNLQEDYASIPNSQTSSLNDHFSVNTSQTSVSCDQHADMSEGEGNAQNVPKYALVGGSDGSLKKAMPMSKATATEGPARNTSHPSQVPHGQKRMSNGHLKSPNADSPTSPSEATFRASHARRLSNVSSGSQVGEVSKSPSAMGKLTGSVQLAAQLRTRLSYAMLKVENGWQDRTIEEVESLASRQTSMAPPTPAPLQSQGSPRSEGPYHKRTELAHSPKRSLGSLANDANIARDHGGSPQTHRSTTSSHALLYPTSQPARSQQHRPSRSRDRPVYLGSPPPVQTPRLAPAFDASSRDARRVAQPNPPRLNTNSLSNLSNNSIASTLSSNPPSTPPPRPASLAKSPSCTTPMEQDAIETLLTMSSPGNSQHGPRYGHLPGSPLRNHFRPPERHVGFASSNPPQPSQVPKVRLRTDEDVDRYLNEMSKDDESSDE